MPHEGHVDQGGRHERNDEANVQLGITRIEYLDSDGVTRHTDYSEIPEYPTRVAKNRLTRVDWSIAVGACWADWLVNMFYWDYVS